MDDHVEEEIGGEEVPEEVPEDEVHMEAVNESGGRRAGMPRGDRGG